MPKLAKVACHEEKLLTCEVFQGVAGSPIIFMNIFHLSANAYGGIFAMLSVGVIGGFGLVPTIVFFFLFLSSVGFSLPNASALALAPFTRNAGSSLGIAAVLCGTALGGLLVLALGRRKLNRPIGTPQEAPLAVH